MKKIVLFAVLAIAGISTVNAQTKPAAKKAETTKTTQTPKVDGAGMLFDSETIDYGTIPYKSDGTREFWFTNNGTKPLKIESTQGSCGCTVPTKPEGEIAPGARASIKVHYDTARGGQSFTKTVTVKSNAVGQETKVLTIKGTVQADPNAAAPAATPATPATPTKS